jgi:hypothetical protein
MEQSNNMYLNQMYEVSTLLEFMALGEILDVVSPYNVSHIWTNWITRYLGIAGKTINNHILTHIVRIVFEDVPQLVIQLIFTSRINT